MRKKSLISLILVLALVCMTLAGCTKGDDKKTDTPTTGDTSTTPDDTKTPDDATTTPDDTTAPDDGAAATTGSPDNYADPYEFTLYYNYDYWAIKQWGEDAASKYMKDKFNVQVNFDKPDADAAARLNLMITSGDLPEAIMMDRSADLIKLAKTGRLVPLSQLKWEGNWYDENILAQTQELLKVEGELYSIPNWPRKGPTGGNDGWQVNKAVYEAAGSPELKTFEDLHNYALKAKELNLKPYNGADIIPFMTGETANGYKIMRAFYRAHGGPSLAESWFSPQGGELKFALRDELMRTSFKEMNKWYHEGLFNETLFTDSQEQTIEKLTSARPALLWYDFSQEDINHYKSIVEDSTNGENTYQVLKDPVYPGVGGCKTYGDECSTPGWNVTVITDVATNPQRIFDLYSWFLTKEGSINMMYGPQGDLWDELDENGNPILKTPEAKISTEEKTRLGLWQWAEPGHSDNVDLTKFAVNAALPEEERSWVISLQSDVFTPTKFVTDEFVGLPDTIDPQEDLGIRRKLVIDQIEAQVPKIIIAKDEAECMKLYDELIKFCDDNGMLEVEQKYNEKYQANVKMQGYSSFE